MTSIVRSRANLLHMMQIYSGEAMASSIKLLGRRAGGDPGPSISNDGEVKAVAPSRAKNAQRELFVTRLALHPYSTKSASPLHREMHPVSFAVIAAAVPGVHAARGS